ncbi:MULTISPECIES: RNA-guided endonuclease InsQ/TnpB family protein [unclassified Variovorax]|uniref:RNA-guided endonuclease InsQ/TnpB family protein n=1 Tax=unclassified Variovorax TaxID=663243 RepID=UPI0022B2A3CA|nr:MULTISPECIES: transposase [unclassified Variovorax]
MSLPSSPPLSTRVLRLRLKDKHAAVLRAMARDVNQVWNYCNDLGQQVLRREGRFMSGFDFQKYLNGASKAGLLVGSAVFQQVAEEFATRRRQFKKARLRWRISDPKRANRSLGWIPFKARSLRYKGGQVAFQGHLLSLWDSYGLAGHELGAGSISEDARGRWYLNVTVQVQPKAKPSPEGLKGALGADLGLKSHMTDSAGTSVDAQRFYRDLESKIASAQRAGKAHRVRALHAKVANRRKDFLHKLSTAQARGHAAVFVGDVNAATLAKTRMAKSVHDAGWSSYRTMLKYKCDDAGAWFAEVDESFSTQDCNICGTRAGPKGRAGLAVRQWTCPCCGASHDRDVNAARNILARGLVWLEKTFSAADSRSTKSAAAVNKVPGPSGLGAAAGHGRPAGGIPVL